MREDVRSRKAETGVSSFAVASIVVDRLLVMLIIDCQFSAS